MLLNTNLTDIIDEKTWEGLKNARRGIFARKHFCTG